MTNRRWNALVTELGDQARAVLDYMRVLATYRRIYGDAGLGVLIVSMTRNVGDLLGRGLVGS